ncbi:alpha-E domain-containing protein [Chryseolinea lacunae]|uniref:Alpha-E domain-containing protein n=1 Tax=Chryseolinea lacunae TaxID=2801331 RepID=A0ABS1KW91_9BACT|nr:alpha-E domain-containing protein [Chryseolinea lacunae]MBL0743522.1 alpha-E domain-containing protein [Chryseolinea lacunae]
MLSRVADSLYWMSRYMERTDSILRMLKINYASSQDSPEDFSWQPVLRIFGSLDDDAVSDLDNNGRKVLQYMVLDRDNPNSVFNMVTIARENARGVQDNITTELWKCLNEFYHVVREERLKYALQFEDPVTVLDALIKECMIYFGVTDITMFRGEGLCFMNVGKYMERAIQSADILDVKLSNLSYDLDKPTDTAYWKYLLMSISGYSLYLKRYQSGFEARNVIDQVLFNVDFPRSVLYSLNQLTRYFERLKGEQNQEGFAKVQFMIGKLRSKVQYSNVQSVSRIGLHDYLTEITTEIDDIGSTLNKYYFAYS